MVVTLILLLCVGVTLQRGRGCGDDGDGEAAGREVRSERWVGHKEGETEGRRDGGMEGRREREAAEETDMLNVDGEVNPLRWRSDCNLMQRLVFPLMT